MNHLLQQCLVTAVCILPSLLSLPAAAEAPLHPPAATLAAATEHAPLLLDDEALDAIDAAGYGATAFGFASADRGQAFSFSVAQLVSSRMVTVSLSQSLALAIGANTSAATGATAGRF